jgi:hypothetical protein
MAPVAPKDSPASAAARPNSQPAPPPNTTLSGTWKFNNDESDDGEKKLEQARANRSNSGGYPGGGYPGGGPGITLGGHHGMGGEDSQGMSEYLNPADNITVVKQDAELDVTGSDGRKRDFFTDGRKLQKSKDDNYKEIKAHWHDGDLVSQEKTPRGADLSRTFELASEGHQLYETIRFTLGRSNSLVVIRYVYDLVQPTKPQ